MSTDLMFRIGGDSTPAERAATRAEIAMRKYQTAVQRARAEMEADFSKRVANEKALTEKQVGALADLGKGMFALGAIAAAGVALAAKAFADFDQAMSNVQAATHETAENMGLLRDAALDAGQSTVFSATEAAGAIEELAKAGFTTAEIIGGGLAGALNLAAAGGLAVTEAAETMASAIKLFNLEGDQAAHVADLFAAGAGKAQGSVHDLGMAFNQSAGVAADMGLSIEETSGALAMFAANGYTGSDAGTMFKTMLLSLNPTSKEAATKMAELGISFYDANGQLLPFTEIAEVLKTRLTGLGDEARTAALKTIFGNDAYRAAAVAFKEGAEGAQEWQDNVNDAGFAAETAAIKMDNLKGDIEKLGGAIETALIGLGEAADDPLRSITQALTDVVDWFANLDPAIQTTVLAVAAIAAGVGILGGGFLMLIPRIHATQVAMGKLGVTAKGASLALGGIGLVLTAGALIFGSWAKAQAEARDRATEFGATLDENTGAVTTNTRAWAENELVKSGVLDSAKKLGISTDVLTGAYLGNASSLKIVNAALERNDPAIRTAIRGGTELRGAVSDVREVLGQGAQAADDFAESSDLVGKAARDAAMLVRTKREEIEGVGAAFDESARTASATAAVEVKAAEEAAKAYERQADEILGVLDAQRKLSGAVMSAAEASASYQQSLDDLDGVMAGIKEQFGSLDEALNETKTGFDDTTQAGRDLQDATFDVAKTQVDAAYAAFELAKSTGGDLVKANEDLVTSLTASRDSLALTLIDMGIEETAAYALADSIVEIPDLSQTEVEVLDEEAKRKVEEQEERLRILAIARETKLNADPAGAITGVDTAQAALDTLHDKSVYVTVYPLWDPSEWGGPDFGGGGWWGGGGSGDRVIGDDGQSGERGAGQQSYGDGGYGSDSWGDRRWSIPGSGPGSGSVSVVRTPGDAPTGYDGPPMQVHNYWPPQTPASVGIDSAHRLAGMAGII